MIVMRRAPRWRGGRFRVVRRPLPPEIEGLPLWARIGFMVPLQAWALLVVVAVALALAGGAAMLIEIGRMRAD